MLRGPLRPLRGACTVLLTGQRAALCVSPCSWAVRCRKGSVFARLQATAGSALPMPAGVPHTPDEGVPTAYPLRAQVAHACARPHLRARCMPVQISELPARHGQPVQQQLQRPMLRVEGLASRMRRPGPTQLLSKGCSGLVPQRSRMGPSPACPCLARSRYSSLPTKQSSLLLAARSRRGRAWMHFAPLPCPAAPRTTRQSRPLAQAGALLRGHSCSHLSLMPASLRRRPAGRRSCRRA